MSHAPEDTVADVVTEMINDGSLDVNDIDANADIIVTVTEEMYG